MMLIRVSDGAYAATAAVATVALFEAIKQIADDQSQPFIDRYNNCSRLL